MGSDPKVYWKINGYPWKPGAWIHVAYQNYIAYFQDTAIAVLQIDKFNDVACIIHGWVLPEYCKGDILKLIGKEMLDVFQELSEFEKIIAHCPATAKHAIRWLKNLGFEKEGVIKDSAYYRLELVDSILMTYKIGRD